MNSTEIKNKKFCLVIPTNRVENLEHFLNSWNSFSYGKTKDLLKIIVVVDRSSFVDGEEHKKIHNKSSGFYGLVDFYDWRDIELVERSLGRSSSVFSKKDSAIRCFGFLAAMKYKTDYIITLDDDCFPLNNPDVLKSECDLTVAEQNSFYGFPEICSKDITKKSLELLADEHINSLSFMDRNQSSVPGLRVRGLPYIKNISSICPVVNVGLWQGHYDIDAISRVMNLTSSGVDSHKKVHHLPRHMIADKAFMYPVCGMNLCFSTNVLPAMFFPRMGLYSEYSRFDDIWMGYFLQKVISVIPNFRIRFGSPFVYHNCRSDAFNCFKRETPGIPFNEFMYDLFSSFDYLDKEAEEGIANLNRLMPAVNGFSRDVFDIVCMLVRKCANKLKSVSFPDHPVYPDCDFDYIIGWGNDINAWVDMCCKVLDRKILV